MRETLRAKSLDETPSLNLVKKRIDHMIKVFEKLHESRIVLNTWLERKDYALCTVGKADECGTVGCVAGHIVLQFAPKNLKMDRSGNLIFKSGGSYSPAYVAGLLMGSSIHDVKYMLDGLFEGGSRGDAGRQTALHRLRNFRMELDQIKTV